MQLRMFFTPAVYNSSNSIKYITSIYKQLLYILKQQTTFPFMQVHYPSLKRTYP